MAARQKSFKEHFVAYYAVVFHQGPTCLEQFTEPTCTTTIDLVEKDLQGVEEAEVVNMQITAMQFLFSIGPKFFLNI